MSGFKVILKPLTLSWHVRIKQLEMKELGDSTAHMNKIKYNKLIQVKKAWHCEEENETDSLAYLSYFKQDMEPSSRFSVAKQISRFF